MHDRGECHDAGEEVGVFGERDGKRDELGDVLGGLDCFHRVHVVGLARDDWLVWCTGCHVLRDAGVQL